MAQFKFLPIPSEEYDALGISPNTILETRITDDGALIVRRVSGKDLEEFVCDGDCDFCPVADTDCDGDCLSCPCYACCDDSDYTPKEGKTPSRKAYTNPMAATTNFRRE